MIRYRKSSKEWVFPFEVFAELPFENVLRSVGLTPPSAGREPERERSSRVESGSTPETAIISES
jgi:hypothetical protein